VTSASWSKASPSAQPSPNTQSAPDRTYGVPGSPDALRHVMGHFASGVTIATALHLGIKHAMTATAVCSVSLEPPLVLVCVSKSSRFHGAIMTAANWCLSLLTVHQEPLARHFSNRGRDLLSQFDNVPHVPSPLSGTPLIDGALAWLECTTYGVHDGGDHTIVVGEIVRASGLPSDDDPNAPAPLTYYRGAYS
jgi:flavin reductase (DIM6/NTAB) family NADH-FMN oxidoreductase RutF